MLTPEEQISELEDVVASLDAQFEAFVNELCKIIFEGEDTEIGRKITIDRIKALACYNGWLESEENWNMKMDEPLKARKIK